MPEIAEVERARLRIHRQVLNYKITNVETTPDNLVYSGIEAKEFGESIMNKTLIDSKRWGKYFVLLFDKGPHIVAHLGMTGGVRFEYEETEWPPKHIKLMIEFKDPKTEAIVRFGFKDPRRISRLRLIEDPMKSEPINKLGFDPVLSMPTFQTFFDLVKKRRMPIKGLLLDQSFSAGVGNWVADEILFQAEVHPAQYTNTLNEHELLKLYDKISFVCQTAVAVEADESKFPDNWLMKYRWSKGKGFGKGILPDGQVLAFETIAGRTTAFSPSRQILNHSESQRKNTSKTRIKEQKKVEKIKTEKPKKIEKKKLEKSKNVKKQKVKLDVEKFEKKPRNNSSRYNLRS